MGEWILIYVTSTGSKIVGFVGISIVVNNSLVIMSSAIALFDDGDAIVSSLCSSHEARHHLKRTLLRAKELLKVTIMITIRLKCGHASWDTPKDVNSSDFEEKYCGRTSITVSGASTF